MKHRILGIDPGSACGWAIIEFPGETVAHSGVWTLKHSALEGGGMMFVRLEAWLRAVVIAAPPMDPVKWVDVIAVEDVRRHAGTIAAHIYGGVIATVTRVCEEVDVPYCGIGVGVWKKRCVGKGNASKEECAQAAGRKWPYGLVIEQDAIDAAFVALAAGRELGWGET